MMAVPDAALLPSTPRPVCRENSSRMSFENPSGNTGNARSRTMPIISQCPVTESFPGDASAILPNAPGVRPVSDTCLTPVPVSLTPLRHPRRSRPRARSVGSFSGICRSMLPIVLLPSSPYAGASGSSPMPTPSMTMTMARLNGRRGALTGLLVREIVRHRPRRLDRRDGVLEDHVIGAAVIEHQREAIEVLDAPLELRAVHHADGDRELLAPHIVEKHVLDVRLGVDRFRIGGRSHQRSVSRSRESIRLVTAAIVVADSPGPSNQTRLGSLRNQINWRRA